MVDFSIIIPIYNSEKYLEKCINSVLNQNYNNYEVILIDDGSKDDSLNLLYKLYSNDNRVKIFTKNNTGVADTRNFGISKALGRWITFLDSDDWLDEDALLCVRKEILENDSLDIIETNLFLINDKDNTLIPNDLYDNVQESMIDVKDKNNFLDSIISIHYFGNKKFYNKYGNCRCIGGKFYKKDLIIKNQIVFPTNIRIFEDGIFNLYASYYANKIKILPKKVYYYRQLSISSTHTVNLDFVNEICSILNELEKFLYFSNFYSKESLIYSASDLMMFAMTRLAQKHGWVQIFRGMREYRRMFNNLQKYVDEIVQKNNIPNKCRIMFRFFQRKNMLVPYVYFLVKNSIQNRRR